MGLFTTHGAKGRRFESLSFLFFRMRDAFVSLVSGIGEIRRDAATLGPEGETAREEEEEIRKWKMDVKKDKKVRRKARKGSRFKSIKLSTQSRFDMERK